MLVLAAEGSASALCALPDNACDAYRAVGPQLAEHPGAEVLIGITFHLSRADSRRLLPVVLELVAEGRFDPLAVPTTVVPWDRADEAWLEPATKLVLERK
jgi:hypothetical protein